MPLEKQVCSLELAKKLKELGVKQESLFWWSVPVNQTAPEPDFSALEQCKPEVFWGKVNWGKYFEPIAAFTVAELANELAKRKHCFLPSLNTNFDGGWYYNFFGGATVHEDTLADCMGRMLIYLIENDLLNK